MRLMKIELPKPVNEVCEDFVGGLREILASKLFGVYLYGAAVFPESGPIQDIDCHVILDGALTESERNSIITLHEHLAQRFPPLGGELDAYYILLEDARGTVPPQHQVWAEIYDHSWALHCAHIRAGRFIHLWGQDAGDIFPSPTWENILAALDHELSFIEENLNYPAYCMLNLCRIMYSFAERNVVVSKQFSGNWACDRFPEWEPVISAAMRFYKKETQPGDDELMREEMEDFLAFAQRQIRQFCVEITSIC
jgi:hypothetical protein